MELHGSGVEIKKDILEIDNDDEKELKYKVMER